MSEIGPYAWMNWQSYTRGMPYHEGREAILFTDSSLTGFSVEGNLGPYSIVNALGFHQETVRPAPALHIDLHEVEMLPTEPPPLAPDTGAQAWTRLSIDQEISCILSLTLGIRLASSGWSRVFDEHSPQGRPQFINYEPPAMPPIHGHHRMLPGWNGKSVDITGVGDQLRSYASLSATDAVALARAAREYSQAVWIAESDPEMSWLQLVSALEVAALQWDSSEPNWVAEFANRFPELNEKLTPLLGDALMSQLAETIKDTTRSTAKFLNFCLHFLPSAPVLEGEWPNQLDWNNKGDFKRRLQTIYKHRSRRLHSAIPFPNTLLTPEPLETPLEVPIGLGSGSGYSTWKSSDTPLTLYAFAHLTRGALLRWWNEDLNNRM